MNEIEFSDGEEFALEQSAIFFIQTGVIWAANIVRAYRFDEKFEIKERVGIRGGKYSAFRLSAGAYRIAVNGKIISFIKIADEVRYV